MAMPKKRMSRVRSAWRRATIFLTFPSTHVCTCGATAVRHQACAACGVYNGRKTILAK